MFFFRKRKAQNLSQAEIDRLSKADRKKLVERLKEEGGSAWEDARLDDALEIYRQLIRLLPSDAEYRRRLADCHQKLGNTAEELNARLRAAALYAEAGFLLKGIAMCKMALSLDPQHAETKRMLAELSELGGHNLLPTRARIEELRRGLDPKPAPESAEATASALALAKLRVEGVKVTQEKVTRARQARAKSLAALAAPFLEGLQAPVPPVAASAPSLSSLPVSARAPRESSVVHPRLSRLPLKSALPSLPSGTVFEEEASLPAAFRGSQASSTIDSDASPDSSSDIYIAPLDDDAALPAIIESPNRSFAGDTADDEIRDGSALLVSAAPYKPPVDGSSADDPDAEATWTDNPIAQALRRVPLLSELSPETFVRLVEEVDLLSVPKGSTLFCAGDPADAMYAIVEGSVTALTPPPLEFELSTLGEGDFFGEIGLLARQPRQATIVANVDTLLLVFPADVVDSFADSDEAFVRTLLRFVRERLVASLVQTNPLFSAFSDREATDLARKFQFLEVGASTTLVKWGEPSSGVFILLTGGARVVREAEGEATAAIGRLEPGDIFGEMSVLDRKPAMASVITDDKCFVLKLPAATFTTLVMMNPVLLDHVSRIAESREKSASLRDEQGRAPDGHEPEIQHVREADHSSPLGADDWFTIL